MVALVSAGGREALDFLAEYLAAELDRGRGPVTVLVWDGPAAAELAGGLRDLAALQGWRHEGPAAGGLHRFWIDTH